MKLETYFNQGFQKHLGQLQFRPVNQVLKDLFHDASLVFFGGRDWVYIQQDLAGIPHAERAHFVYALLTIVLTDQCMQAYFKSDYPHWRQATGYPKFGWCGFGLNNENPYKLLAKAEASGLVDVQTLNTLMPEFVVFMRNIVRDYFSQHLPRSSVQRFFSHLLSDGINQYEEGSVVPALRTLARRVWLEGSAPASSPFSPEEALPLDWAAA